MHKEYSNLIPLIIFAFIVSIIFRVYPIIKSDFPINDGGLFFVMIEDLKNENFSLPKFTTFNLDNIPYTYPPLAFYLTAVVSDLTQIDTINLLRWLPVIISIFTIPAFYWLTKKIIKSELTVIIATVAFALLPHSFEWQIMGAGLTRGLGLLLALLALAHGISLFRSLSVYNLLYTIVFSSLTILSHPEAGWFVIYSLVLFLFFIGINRRRTFYLMLIAFGVIIVTLPWWLTIINYHGLSPFLSAFDSKGHWLLAVYHFLFLDFLEQPLLDIFGTLALLGTLASILKREFQLPIWVLFIIILNPRSLYRFAIIPLSFLGANALTEIIIPGIKKMLKDVSQSKIFYGNLFSFINFKRFRFTTDNITVFIVGTLWIYSSLSYLSLQSISGTKLKSLSHQERTAMLWVAERTERNSSFLVIPKIDSVNWALENSMVWFPAISQRKSISTVQGYEWKANDFDIRISAYQELKECIYQSYECLLSWVGQYDKNFSHIYLTRIKMTEEFQTYYSPLEQSLRDASEFKIVFENEGAMIFARSFEK